MPETMGKKSKKQPNGGTKGKKSVSTDPNGGATACQLRWDRRWHPDQQRQHPQQEEPLRPVLRPPQGSGQGSSVPWMLALVLLAMRAQELRFLSEWRPMRSACVTVRKLQVGRHNGAGTRRGRCARSQRENDDCGSWDPCRSERVPRDFRLPRRCHGRRLAVRRMRRAPLHLVHRQDL